MASTNLKHMSDSIVLEYLEHEALFDTWECFRNERQAKDMFGETKVQDGEEKKAAEGGYEDDEIDEKVELSKRVGELRNAMRRGDADGFLNVWQMFASDDEENDSEVDLLTFDLNLYWFTFEEKSEGTLVLNDTETKRERLLAYFRQKGAVVGQRHPELFQFFGLPFVESRKTQEPFCKCYSPEWRKGVQERVEKIVKNLRLSQKREPKLTSLIREEERIKDVFRQELDDANEKRDHFEKLTKRLFAISVKLLKDLSESHDETTQKDESIAQTKRILSNIRKEMNTFN